VLSCSFSQYLRSGAADYREHLRRARKYFVGIGVRGFGFVKQVDKMMAEIQTFCFHKVYRCGKYLADVANVLVVLRNNIISLKGLHDEPCELIVGCEMPSTLVTYADLIDNNLSFTYISKTHQGYGKFVHFFLTKMCDELFVETNCNMRSSNCVPLIEVSPLSTVKQDIISQCNIQAAVCMLYIKEKTNATKLEVELCNYSEELMGDALSLLRENCIFTSSDTKKTRTFAEVKKYAKDCIANNLMLPENMRKNVEVEGKILDTAMKVKNDGTYDFFMFLFLLLGISCYFLVIKY
jgi:hypothetical protein